MPTSLFAACLLLSLSSAFAGSTVWLVEKGNSQLYLAGTIHILRAQDYPLPKAFDKAYAASEALYFEVDLADTESAEFQQALLQAVRLPPGQKLANRLTSATYARLQDYLRERGLPIEPLQTLTPSVVSLNLALLELTRLGISSVGADKHFFDRAKADGKQTGALETTEQQVTFIATLGDGLEDQMISQTLGDLETLGDDFPQMIKSWRHGDSKALDALFVAPMREQFYPVYQRLLVDRNNAWLPQIERLLDSPRTEMVLVGSAHLVGEDGLVRALRASGYRLEQLD